MGPKTSFQYKYIVDLIPITLLMYGRKITERERGERISCTLFVDENRTSKERKNDGEMITS